MAVVGVSADRRRCAGGVRGRALPVRGQFPGRSGGPPDDRQRRARRARAHRRRRAARQRDQSDRPARRPAACLLAGDAAAADLRPRSGARHPRHEVPPRPRPQLPGDAAQRGGYDITLPGVAFARRRDDGPQGPDDEPLPPPPRVFHVGNNEGFVLDFARVLSGDVSAFEERLLRGEVMGYHPAEHVPFFRFLAEQYAVCDRWFASHPGHTWPNRFVSLTGASTVDATACRKWTTRRSRRSIRSRRPRSSITSTRPASTGATSSTTSRWCGSSRGTRSTASTS